MELPKIVLAKREALSTEIARQLLEHLLSGQVQFGDRLPSERQLAQTLGVGRSAVRDALKSLSLLGVIDVRQGDGTYFQKVPSDLLPRSVEWGLLLGERHTLDLVEARGYIEVAVARLAAERRDEQALQDLVALLDDMREARFDPERFAEADLAFHLRIANAGGNTVLRDVLSSMRSLLHVWIRRVIAAAGDAEYSYQRHRRIYEAIAQGDPEVAARAMTEHMESANARLMKTLKLDGRQAG